MQINSELPLCMLNVGTPLNDYDFVLLHLMNDEKYLNWVLRQRREWPDRLMIMDNSAYEYFVKGEEFNPKWYTEMICIVKPDYYILPDVLMDKDATLKGTIDFLYTYGAIGTSKPLAVAQGNSEEDLVECILKYKEIGIEYLGIPFHLKFYTELAYDFDIMKVFKSKYPEMSEDILYAMGRVQFVRNHMDVINEFPKVHFLGSHCPLEKVFYKWDNATMDTGYPVKLAMEGTKLFKETKKPEIIIDDFLYNKLTDEQQGLIINNVMKFKLL